MYRFFFLILLQDIKNRKKSTLLKRIFTGFRMVIDQLFPQVCPLCGNVLQAGENRICLQCLNDLPVTGIRDPEDNPAARVFWGRIPFEGVISFLNYEKGNKASRLIREIKYHGNKELGYDTGRYFGRKLSGLAPFLETDAIVPVPLHRRKMKQRGFNQSEYIGRGLAEVLHKPLVPDVLYRRVYNPTQTRKGRYQRWENVEGIFAVRDPAVFAGKHLLLVDDVITTGATLEACASAILAVAPARISIVSLALAR